MDWHGRDQGAPRETPSNSPCLSNSRKVGKSLTILTGCGGTFGALHGNIARATTPRRAAAEAVHEPHRIQADAPPRGSNLRSYLVSCRDCCHTWPLCGQTRQRPPTSKCFSLEATTQPYVEEKSTRTTVGLRTAPTLHCPSFPSTNSRLGADEASPPDEGAVRHPGASFVISGCRDAGAKSTSR